MTLPASGAISMSQVAVEVNVAPSTAISLNDAAVRTLFGVSGSGTTISLTNGYGKSGVFYFNIAGGSNVDVRTAAIAAGWQGTTNVVATVTADVTSTSTGSAAMTVSGSFPNGLSIVVNAGVYIYGRGGNGADAYNGITPAAASWGRTGGAGGVALSVSTAVSITNNGIIGGGGGGGGGNGCGVTGTGGASYRYGGGGGSGGGQPGLSYDYTVTVNSTYGNLPTAGSASASGTGGNIPGGSYGGSVGPGVAGITFTSRTNTATGGSGGGGGLGAYGGTTSDVYQTYQGSSAGGAPGACTAGNANITWLVAGSRYGALN